MGILLVGVMSDLTQTQFRVYEIYLELLQISNNDSHVSDDENR